MAASSSSGRGDKELCGLPKSSLHFATNFNESIARSGQSNTGYYLSIATVNVGGKRRQAWKNDAILQDLKTIRCGIITFEEYDSALSLEGQDGFHSEELRFISMAAAAAASDTGSRSGLGVSYRTDVIRNHSPFGMF